LLEPEALPLSGACAQSGSDAAAKQATSNATPKSDFIPNPLNIGRKCGRKCHQGGMRAELILVDSRRIPILKKDRTFAGMNSSPTSLL
jgi:hypothetical protein